MRTLKNLKGILARWLEEIQQYNFQVIHKPGRSNINVDALSHSTHLPAASQEEEEEEQRLSAVEVLFQTGSKQLVQQTAGAAGYDLSATINATCTGQVTPVPLNLKLAIPAGYYLQLALRSRLVSQGLLVVGGNCGFRFLRRS